MKHFRALGMLVAASWLAAIPLYPADPPSILFAMAVIMPVGIAGYLLGIRNSRISVVAENPKTQREEQTAAEP